MSSERETFLIGDLGRVVTGKTPSTNNPSFYEGDIPFYTPSDMDGRRFLDQTKRSLSELGALSVGKSAIEAGSVMVSCIGSDMGKVAIAPKSGITNQQINTISTHEWVDPLYLYYELKTRKAELQTLATGGSAQPILNKGHFCEIEVEIPTFSKQKAIAYILGTLDSKIELNRKTNKTFEGITKSLFKSWFVDFDPVRAKAEGRPTGLPDEITKLFPDSFEESELGEIPSGWSVTEVGDCSLEIESGKRPKGGINKGLGAGIPSVGAESVDVAGLFDFGKTKYVSDEFASSVTKGWVRELDVALYKDGGKPGEFKPRVAIYGSDFPFPRFMVNEHVFLLRSVELGQSFLYHLFGFDLVREQIIHMGSSKGAQPGLNQQEVKSSVFVKPAESILRVFAEVIEAPMARQFHLGKQNLLLEQLRDALLPRLISGDLRIADAEKMLEEVGI